jgi:putative restriction endonuclease
MSFWWVNHRQTAKIEIGEGYIWSPKRNKNNSINQTYLNLERAKLGDVIFSYADQQIAAIGKVIAEARDEERPTNFGSTGDQWNKDGWIVGVQWVSLETPIIPKNHLAEIVPLLPTRNSPIRSDGNGNQSCYLAEIRKELAYALYHLLNDEEGKVTWHFEDIDRDMQEMAEEERIVNSDMTKTQRNQLIQARVGQGLFRMNVEKIETQCRITGLADRRVLIASHIKSWKDSTNGERLDGHNGFLMSPHVDRLFDRGWISFSGEGKILIYDQKISSIFMIWALDSTKWVGDFTPKQKKYLEFHRDVIFKKSI